MGSNYHMKRWGRHLKYASEIVFEGLTWVNRTRLTKLLPKSYEHLEKRQALALTQPYRSEMRLQPATFGTSRRKFPTSVLTLTH